MSDFNNLSISETSNAPLFYCGAHFIPENDCKMDLLDNLELTQLLSTATLSPLYYLGTIHMNSRKINTDDVYNTLGMGGNADSGG